MKVLWVLAVSVEVLCSQSRSACVATGDSGGVLKRRSCSSRRGNLGMANATIGCPAGFVIGSRA